MCTPNQPKVERVLRKEDFIIPEGWEPTSPSLKRLIELKEQVVRILGPDLVREILEEAGVIPEETECESRDRR